MSCSIKWKPSGSGRALGATYSSLLARAIARGLGSSRITLTSQHLEFLRGLDAAGIEGADALVDLIHEHDSIDIWEEC